MERREKAAFEAGIKLGAAFHQFIGVPVSDENLKLVEKAIESCIKLQPYVVEAEVRIDREKMKLSELGYTSLSPEMLYVKVTVEFRGERVTAVLEWDEDLKYPMMRII